MMARIVCLVWSSYAGTVAEAAARRPEADGLVFSSKALENQSMIDLALRSVESASAVFLFRTAEILWDQFDEPIKAAAEKIPVVSVSYDPAAWNLSSVTREEAQRAYQYLLYGGAANADHLLKYLAALSGYGDIAAVAEPEPQPWEGLWHPQAPQPYFGRVEEYLAWYDGYCRKKGSNGPKVGLLMGRHYWVNSMPDVETALIHGLESKGLGVICAFTNTMRDVSLGNKGSNQWSREAFLDDNGGSRIEALIKLLPYFCRSSSSSVKDGIDSPAWPSVELFQKLNVPVFQPVFSSVKTLEEWEADPQGLSSEVAWAVAMPEFEGATEPFLLGGPQPAAPSFAATAVERRVPHLERIERFCGRVTRWVALRNKPVEQRKVAFILHNDPCSSVEATVGGAAKLDSLESLSRILKAMRDRGYQVEAPGNGWDLIEKILERKAISEFRWTTVEEIVGRGGALTELELPIYQKWFDSYPHEVRQAVSEGWGAPPGEAHGEIPAAMVLNGRIIITGLKLGSAVVCVQPKRGCAGSRCDGAVCKILHDPNVPPPHQYIATYRWLQDGFGADLIVHVGTHGNLEFLPGKSVGLSGRCLPDLVLHEVPHVYIYNSDNPAEGVIAKRRSYATVVDHMQTVLVGSEAEADLTDLENYLGEWERARLVSPSRAHQLEHLIKEEIQARNLAEQVRLDQADDFAALATRTHEAIGLLANTAIDDGMHIFGETPVDDRRTDFIYSIIRHDAGQETSLRRLLCQAQGLNLDDLLAAPGLFDEKRSQSQARLLAMVEEQGREICRRSLAPDGAETDKPLPLTAREFLGEKLLSEEPLQALGKISDRIKAINRRLERTDEIPSLLNSFEGQYVPPGPSGLISRGQEDILPTGRNFYTLDPRRLPTRAAWRVGWNLAQAVIDKFQADEGRFPENIAMFWMSNDLMWTDGEGLGQIIALLGVRPRWQPSGQVSGFEVIPLSELDRPRIDVTIRVSGLLRDSFPAAINLVDEAVQAVSRLDEEPEWNYVRKHTLARLDELPTDADEAWRRATFRIFSSQAGVYQAGVNLAVQASAWETDNDLADIFVHWNGYAYGLGAFGVESPRALEASLSTVDVTYNKVVSDEHDLLGCCAYFGTQGGMTAAASHFKGEKVIAYYGDTREPQSVQVRDLADELRRVVRTRLLNQKWIDGMKRHGYKGAADISKRAGRIYGWEATTQEVDDWIFDEIAQTFVLNRENREFFEEHNPWALYEISRRILESSARDLWQADQENLQSLKEGYLEMEGWLEERTENFGGEFQGGSVDVVTAADVEAWKANLARMRAQDN
jgi:cobaltochelatase CobN